MVAIKEKEQPVTNGENPFNNINMETKKKEPVKFYFLSNWDNKRQEFDDLPTATMAAKNDCGAVTIFQGPKIIKIVETNNYFI